MRILAAAAIILLTLPAGMCVTTRTVTVYCVTPEQLEKLKAKKPGKVKERLNGDLQHDNRLITGRLIRMEGYAEGLITVMGGCVDPKLR